MLEPHPINCCSDSYLECKLAAPEDDVGVCVMGHPHPAPTHAPGRKLLTCAREGEPCGMLEPHPINCCSDGWLLCIPYEADGWVGTCIDVGPF